MIVAEREVQRAGIAAPSVPWHRHLGWWLVPILLLAGGAMLGAARQTSTTFDEILLPSSGARGYVNGRFDLVLDHPPLLAYVYGLPVHLAHPRLPVERGAPNRYFYSRALFFELGNDPERLALLARLPAIALALALIVLAWVFARRWGEGAGLLAAGFVAFMPDVLAHGAIAYNDLPLALTYFLGAWALDALVRRPSARRAALAGGACALALGVKLSAIALAPVGVGLLVAEALAGPHERAWRAALLRAAPVFAAVLLLGTLVVYRGDFALSDLRAGLSMNVAHASLGGPFPAYLLGRLSMAGFWYFFPVALLYKIPAAFDVLALVAILGFVRAARGRARALLRSRLRMPLVAGLVFAGFLLASRLNIGVRHALPLLPLACVLTAVGLARLWPDLARRARVLVLAMLMAFAVSALSYYPNFLTYTSEFAPPRDLSHRVFVDSNLDWGQGLLQLREYMRRRGIPSVYLSYFGTAEPAAYGIRYLPAPSFFPLPPARMPLPQPRWLAVSATNLIGGYLAGDPFGNLRNTPPTAVVAHTIFLYRLEGR